MHAATFPSWARTFGRRLISTVFALLSTVALAVTGYAHVALDDLRGNIPTTHALDDVPDTPADDGAIDILLVGNDTRTDATGKPLPLEMLKQLRTEHKDGINTDTIIVLRMPKNGAPPKAVSLPRDSWVDVPSGGQNKINSAFNTAKVAEMERLRAKGITDRPRIELASDQVGRKALVQTVQGFTQVRIDHYAEVSLLGFYLLTEALGGVEVCLKQATQDKDAAADFHAGRQSVSGGEALSFVRQRKNLPRGDLDRIVRQQTFLGSALHKVLSAGTLTNPKKLDRLIDAVHSSIVLDPDLDIIEFAERVRGLALGDVEFVTIPVVDINGRSKDGQSIVEVDEEAVRVFIEGLVDDGQGKGVQGSGGGGTGGGLALRQQNDPEPITGGKAPCVN